jgi:hypothetical protein
MLQPSGQNVGRDIEALLEIGEPRHAGKRRVPKDEQAPALAGNLERPRRRAHFLVIGSTEHAWILAPPLA